MTSSELTTDHRPQTTDQSQSAGRGPSSIVRGPAPLRVAVVGPCASGKSTLVAALKAAGYDARHPAQEHSYVKDMWKRLVDPDVLIYLDITYEALLIRRPNYGEPEYLEREKERLGHARAHADLVIDTSELTSGEIRDRVLTLLDAIK